MKHLSVVAREKNEFRFHEVIRAVVHRSQAVLIRGLDHVVALN